MGVQIFRRAVGTFLASFLLVLGTGITGLTGAQAVTLGDDGLHKQTWFLDSFLTIADDVEEAAAEGKRLVILFEQRGCPYCKELHQVNFAKEEIVRYMTENYLVVQLDLWGSREVVDIDGEAMEERDLARKWHVNFTPTVVFVGTPEEIADGTREVARLPGYFKPFHFQSMLEYVRTGVYGDQNFQRFLQVKFEEMKAQGIDPDVW